MTTAAALRDKSADQLQEQLATLKKEQFNLRFQRASGQLEKTSRVREVRRDIARIETILGEWRRNPEGARAAGARKPRARAEKTGKKAPARKRAKKE